MRKSQQIESRRSARRRAGVYAATQRRMERRLLAACKEMVADARARTPATNEAACTPSPIDDPPFLDRRKKT